MSALPYAKLRVLEGRSASESAQLADWRGVASVLSALQGRQRVQHEIAEAIDASVDVPLLVYPEGAVNPVSALNVYRVRTNAHGPLHLPFVYKPHHFHHEGALARLPCAKALRASAGST
jgi:hypothetical protein